MTEPLLPADNSEAALMESELLDIAIALVDMGYRTPREILATIRIHLEGK